MSDDVILTIEGAKHIDVSSAVMLNDNVSFQQKETRLILYHIAYLKIRGQGVFFKIFDHTLVSLQL